MMMMMTMMILNVSILSSDTANGKSRMKSHLGDTIGSSLIPRMHWRWLQVFPSVSPKESQNFSILISRPVLAIDKKSSSLLPYSFKGVKHVLSVRCRHSVYEEVSIAVQCHSFLINPARDTNYDTLPKVSFQANHKYVCVQCRGQLKCDGTRAET